MNQNKHFFILTAIIGAILIIIAAGLYLSKTSGKSSHPLTAADTSYRPTQSGELDQLKTQEFLDEPMLTDFTDSISPAKANQPGVTLPATPLAAQGNAFSPDYPSSHQASRKSNLYAENAPQTALSTSNAVNPSSLFTHDSTQTHANLPSLGNTTLPQVGDTPFSPYMAALNKEQAANLEKQLNGLSDKVQAAILRALLPKSKKDMNIEKYLAHRSDPAQTSAHATGPFAQVADQISRQKTDLVNVMKNAFGNKVANQAGHIMDNYQKDIMSVLNKPGTTPEQIQRQTRQISRKYNEQLQKLSQKSGLERLEQERIKQDTAFEEDLAKSYGSRVAGQLGEVMAQYRQKEIELIQKNLPAEEYYAQIMENQRNRRKEMESIITQNGNSLDGLLTAENKQEKTRIEQKLQEEKEGKAIPTVYRVSEEEKTAFNDNLKQERAEKVQTAQTLYGENGAARIHAIYDRYYEEAAGIMQDEETSLLEKQEKLMQARQKANNEIERIQNTPEMKKLREDKQTNETMQQLLKDPALLQATPEQKEQFEKMARPILHDMFARINEVTANPNLTDDQKKQQIQAIQQQAQRQLAGQ